MNVTLERPIAARPRTTTMKAAVLTAPRELRIDEVAIPQPSANQILVRLEGCGVCAPNIRPWEGKPWFNYPMAPGALGHESWGRIDEAGDEVTEFERGD